MTTVPTLDWDWTEEDPGTCARCGEPFELVRPGKSQPTCDCYEPLAKEGCEPMPETALEATEAECAANATAPRVSLASMEAKILARYDLTGDQALELRQPVHEALERLSLCLLVMQNGFVVVGKSAPASAANFNAELGRKLAYEDAIRQLWPLEGYQLRSFLAADALEPVHLRVRVSQ